MTEVLERRARSTGTTVVLIDNRDGSFDAPADHDDAATRRDMRWATLCADHGAYVLHRSRSLATSFMACPEEWCEECRGE